MFKKSLVLSIAVVLLAVLFVFTGCEGPAGPIGQTGNDGSDVPFPGDITVTMPGGNNVPTLPAGVTYPPLSGAKILSGNAADISKAFNGGILVANTPDSGEFDPAISGTNDGTVYAQDAVDYVVWTGPGNDLSIGGQGSIVVPPGKTLFIAAPLSINIGGAAGTFESITVSDKGFFTPDSPSNLSVQAAVGGTTVSPDSPEGTIVLLNGGSVSGVGAGYITIGGTLEIHHGASITVGNAAFLSTARSTVNVYGQIAATATPLTFNGNLSIKGGGTVFGSSANTPTDVFTGAVTVESYGTLEWRTTPNSPVEFYGTVDVKENGKLTLASGNTNTIYFRDVATIGGTLNAGYNNVTLYPAAPQTPTGRLKITATGKIIAAAWTLINAGDDVSLLAAIAPGADFSKANKYTTIVAPDTGLVTLDFTDQLPVSSYTNLRLLAASQSLSLPGGLSATLASFPLALPFDSNELAVSTNDVELIGYGEIGDVTVSEDKTLEISGGPTAKAGKITVEGSLIAQTATFADGLEELNIGSETVVVEDDAVELFAVTFANASPKITVNQGSELILGPHTAGTLNINPAGSITLLADASLTINGTTSTLARLEEISIAAGAVFDSIATTNSSSFAALAKLTVHGVLRAGVISGNPFNTLQVAVGSTTDVSGTGVAEFRNWNVSAGTNHAFDQLLAITDLTVGSISGLPAGPIPGISSTSSSGVVTEDAGVPTGDGIILRVVGDITADGNFTVSRNLNLLSGAEIVFNTAATTVTINGGSEIRLGDPTVAEPFGRKGLSVVSGSTAVLGTDTASAHLTAGVTGNVGTLTVGISNTGKVIVQPGSALTVGGRFVAGASGRDILAGKADGLITLVDSSLENGSITVEADDTNVAATIAVNTKGVLSIGAASFITQGSKVTLTDQGSIEVGNTFSLAFGSGGGAPNAVRIGEGTLEAPVNGTATIEADASVDGNAAIRGTLIASDGASVLSIPATGASVLDIIGTVTLRNEGNSYDSLAINAATITGPFVFDAAPGHASITVSSTLKGNANSTITTKGNGILTIQDGQGTPATAATLTAIGSQPLAGATLTGTASTTTTLTGSLGLISGSVLNIAGTVVVGDGTANTGSLSIASGSSGKISLPTAATSKITLAVDGTGGKGSLTFGSYTLNGLASGNVLNGSDAPTPALIGPLGAPTLVLDSGDIAAQFSRGGTTTYLTTTAAAGVAAASGAVTITSVGGNTISASSKLYSTD